MSLVADAGTRLSMVGPSQEGHRLPFQPLHIQLPGPAPCHGLEPGRVEQMAPPGGSGYINTVLPRSGGAANYQTL